MCGKYNGIVPSILPAECTIFMLTNAWDYKLNDYKTWMISRTLNLKPSQTPLARTQLQCIRKWRQIHLVLETDRSGWSACLYLSVRCHWTALLRCLSLYLQIAVYRIPDNPTTPHLKIVNIPRNIITRKNLDMSLSDLIGF